MDHGFTALEMVIVLALMAIVVAATAPTVASSRDRMTVRAAREDFVGQVQGAVSAALGNGAATLEVRADSGLVRIVVDQDVRSVVDFRKRYGVELGLAGDAESAQLRFGRLGLGRVASRTVRLYRGLDTVAVSLSTFGRLRRW